MNDHDRCQELLPWYGNGSLNETEMALCEAHVAECEVCHSDLKLMIGQMQELNAHVPDPVDPEPGLQALLTQIRHAPVQPRWHVAVAASLVLGVVLALVQFIPDPGYELLTEPAVGSNTYIQVAFRPGTTEEEIRSFIRSSGGTVTGNPTAAGVYRLRFQTAVTAQTLHRLQRHATIAWANVEL